MPVQLLIRLVAALAERVGDFNVSMDPWERTEAAPQE